MSKYTCITAYCRYRKKAFGVQFENHGNLHTAVASFRTYVSVSASDTEEEVSGVFEISPEYKGCFFCGKPSLYLCKCGTFVCYEGTEGNYTCPICKQKTHVPAAPTAGRIPTSDEMGVDVLLVFDISGSMKKTKKMEVDPLETAKKACIDAFVRQLPNGSRAGVVSFGTDVTYVCPLTSDLVMVENSINALAVNGETTGPLVKIEKEAQYKSFINSSRKRYIVILTDGKWNNEPACLNASKRLQAKGINVIPVAFGEADPIYIKDVMSRAFWQGQLYTLETLASAFETVITQINNN